MEICSWLGRIVSTSWVFIGEFSSFTMIALLFSILCVCVCVCVCVYVCVCVCDCHDCDYCTLFWSVPTGLSNMKELWPLPCEYTTRIYQVDSINNHDCWSSFSALHVMYIYIVRQLSKNKTLIRAYFFYMWNRIVSSNHFSSDTVIKELSISSKHTRERLPTRPVTR